MNQPIINHQSSIINPSVIHEIFVPKETVNDEYVTIAELYFNDRDEVEAGDVVIDVETSKAVISIETEYSGFIEYLCEEGQDIEIGKHVAKIYDMFPDEQKKTLSPHPCTPEQESAEETRFSKAALDSLKKYNLDISIFKGRDLVCSDDVNEHIKNRNGSDGPKLRRAVLPDNTKIDPQKAEIKKLGTAKKSEISYLSDIQTACLNSVVNVFVDIDGIFNLLNDNLDVFKDSLLPVIIYEVSRLLKKYREFNAYYIDDSIAYYKDVHMGLAVDIDDGLKVLKIPGADKKSLKTLETELFDMINRYLNKKLTPDNLTGTTFTITDLSSENVSFFMPLINKEQSAVLGISGIDEKLKRCVLTLTFDHRVTEGKKACQFLSELKERIESYRKKSVSDADTAPDNEIIKCFQCLKTLEEDKDMEGPGLIRIMNHKLEEVYICHICLQGM
ncbi:MAG: hypothetical protein GY795_38530 [Desulfobacterales bacterium]|nr:hypothetical protein [Desulfobacterales bacterium]